MQIRKLLPALLLFAAVSVQAQDKPAAAPFTWKTEGDTAETFKVSLEPNIMIDRTSPEALVKTFMALADGRDSLTPGLAGLEAEIVKVERAEMAAAFDLLAESLQELPAADGHQKTFGDNWKLEVEPPEKWVLKKKGTTDRPKGQTTFVKVEPKADGFHRAYRFECLRVEDDADLWEVGGLQTAFVSERSDATIVPSNPSPQPPRPELEALFRGTFQDYDPGFTTRANLQASLNNPTVNVEGDANKHVRSFFEDLLLNRLTLRTKLMIRVLDAHLAALEPLLAPEFVKELKESANKKAAKAAPLELRYEQLQERDLGGGRVGVLVKTDNFFKSKWLFGLSKANDKWRIDEIKQRFVATRVRDGKEIETFRKVESFWEVAKIEPPSTQSTPMFLHR
ncbi:MAG: hypothetical protein KDB68_14425 [Planctomycetes bacterium]|nr:hypothetical protein [Planctomycetota bacterium]MCA8937391.1 hypothetical protein [Planctomycetota bacterium]